MALAADKRLHEALFLQLALYRGEVIACPECKGEGGWELSKRLGKISCTQCNGHGLLLALPPKTKPKRVKG